MKFGFLFTVVSVKSGHFSDQVPGIPFTIYYLIKQLQTRFEIQTFPVFD